MPSKRLAKSRTTGLDLDFETAHVESPSVQEGNLHAALYLRSLGRQTPVGSESNFCGAVTAHGENCICELGDHHISEHGNNPEFANLSSLDVICQNNLLKT